MIFYSFDTIPGAVINENIITISESSRDNRKIIRNFNDYKINVEIFTNRTSNMTEPYEAFVLSVEKKKLNYQLNAHSEYNDYGVIKF